MVDTKSNFAVLNSLKHSEMVEAAGVEPASENIPHLHLHTYPEI